MFGISDLIEILPGQRWEAKGKAFHLVAESWMNVEDHTNLLLLQNDYLQGVGPFSGYIVHEGRNLSVSGVAVFETHRALW